jgi:energy-coupling factor transporter ATP-binding protein EcfA2
MGLEVVGGQQKPSGSSGSSSSSTGPVGTPSRSKGSKSKFAPFFDDKKREMETPQVPEWRLFKSGTLPSKRNTNVAPTNVEVLDKFLGGGLPKGLTIFVGEAGSGKSTLARFIAKSMKNVLYVTAEKTSDDPEAEGVMVMDYRSFLPRWNKCLAEVLVTAEALKVDAIVIDSATRFFSGTNKAVEEADLRPALFELARKTENIIPVIAISEVRGSGWNMYPAGGQAVAHAPVLLIWFSKFVCRSPESSGRFDKNIGDKVWIIEVGKDSRNLAQSNAEFEVKYGDKEGQIELIEPQEIIKELRGKR